MIRRLIVPIFLLVSIVAVAQDRDERSLDTFDRIKVEMGIKVYLKKSSTEKAVVEVRGIDLDDLVTDVRGGTLHIYIDKSRIGGHVDVNIDLYYKSLHTIDISSAAHVETSSEPITGSSLEIYAASAGGAEIEVNVQDLELDVASAGNLQISGKTTTLDITAASAGSIDAYDLEAEDVRARASGAGSMKIYATQKIDAGASSAGSIRYRGNPQKEYTNTSSGGSIRKSGH